MNSGILSPVPTYGYGVKQSGPGTLNPCGDPASAAIVYEVPAATRPGATQTGDERSAETPMVDSRASTEFEKVFLPHLDAAYNLARLLMRNAEDAADVVQESYLKALRSFSRFRGERGRPWILTIVRNTAFTWLRANRSRGDHTPYNEEIYVSGEGTPEAESLAKERAGAVEDCVGKLPSDFREAIILREMEELSYNEISEITGVPRGTVMSRLSRARARLAECLKHKQAAAATEGRAR